MSSWQDLLKEVKSHLEASEKELEEELTKYHAALAKHTRAVDGLDNLAMKMYTELAKKNGVQGTTCKQNAVDFAKELAYQADEQHIPFPTTTLFLYLDET
uniref:Uncharacterized protein n=1 Tax=viral metagenome TaxID=1070528 RepID=A0A6C0JTZ4_9ZZZZ